MMPLHTQKLILFVMQRSSKNCMLLVGGIYVASLEGFATVMLLSRFLTYDITLDIYITLFVNVLLIVDYELIPVLFYGTLFCTMTL